MATCNWLIPRNFGFLNDLIKTGECPLEEGHGIEGGDGKFHLAEMHDGNFVEWFPEHCPGCTEESCIEDMTCFVWSEVNRDVAMQRIKKE